MPAGGQQLFIGVDGSVVVALAVQGVGLEKGGVGSLGRRARAAGQQAQADGHDPYVAADKAGHPDRPPEGERTAHLCVRGPLTTPQNTRSG